MTKEIIIDGVDVAKCEFLRNCIIPDNYGCKIDDSLCCDVDNCYYKQLKRLEQQNEKLKKEVKQIGSDFIKKGDYVRELEQENERLKEELEKIRNNKCVDCISNLISKNHKKALIKASKVLKTIQEIKAIAIGVRSYLKVPVPRDVRYEMDRILNIITKVEEK